MQHIKLSRLSDRQILRLLNRAEVRFAQNPKDFARRVYSYEKQVHSSIDNFFKSVIDELKAGGNKDRVLKELQAFFKAKTELAKTINNLASAIYDL